MKRLLVFGTLVVVAIFGAAGARADGDPASDILYVQDVFVPYPKPSANLVTSLHTAVAGANEGGMRLKVAVLASESDMGTARSLFGRPGDYAKFLGTELSYNYDGVLLVVMPAGFGVFKGSSSTVKYEHAVSSVNLDASGADGLVRTATAAVHRLVALGIKDVDRAPPLVQTYQARGKRGARVKLIFAVSDKSGRSSEVVFVYAGPRVIATLRSPMKRALGMVDSVSWLVPKRAAATYRFCVIAIDPARNASRPSCAPIRLL